MRNPSSGYFQIPLLDGKGTNNFNPDFVVWDKEEIYALDTKGNHLIIQDSERKLFFIEKAYDEGLPNKINNRLGIVASINQYGFVVKACAY